MSRSDSQTFENDVLHRDRDREQNTHGKPQIATLESVRMRVTRPEKNNFILGRRLENLFHFSVLPMTFRRWVQGEDFGKGSVFGGPAPCAKVNARPLP